jgi:predicted amidophosphoribosyltransferase
LLKKVQTTADQTELTKDERRKNVRGVFEATVKSTNTQTIFVIDDVTTTGATLTETRRALRKVTDADIIGIAFAH